MGLKPCPAVHPLNAAGPSWNHLCLAWGSPSLPSQRPLQHCRSSTWAPTPIQSKRWELTHIKVRRNQQKAQSNKKYYILLRYVSLWIEAYIHVQHIFLQKVVRLEDWDCITHQLTSFHRLWCVPYFSAELDCFQLSYSFWLARKQYVSNPGASVLPVLHIHCFGHPEVLTTFSPKFLSITYTLANLWQLNIGHYFLSCHQFYCFFTRLEIAEIKTSRWRAVTFVFPISHSPHSVWLSSAATSSWAFGCRSLFFFSPTEITGPCSIGRIFFRIIICLVFNSLPMTSLWALRSRKSKETSKSLCNIATYSTREKWPTSVFTKTSTRYFVSFSKCKKNRNRCGKTTDNSFIQEKQI